MGTTTVRCLHSFIKGLAKSGEESGHARGAWTEFHSLPGRVCHVLVPELRLELPTNLSPNHPHPLSHLFLLASPSDPTRASHGRRVLAKASLGWLIRAHWSRSSTCTVLVVLENRPDATRRREKARRNDIRDPRFITTRMWKASWVSGCLWCKGNSASSLLFLLFFRDIYWNRRAYFCLGYFASVDKMKSSFFSHTSNNPVSLRLNSLAFLVFVCRV